MQRAECTLIKTVPNATMLLVKTVGDPYGSSCRPTEHHCAVRIAFGGLFDKKMLYTIVNFTLRFVAYICFGLVSNIFRKTYYDYFMKCGKM